MSRTDRKTNEAVLQETQKSQKLIREIRRRQSKFFGHVMRKNKLENLVTTGEFEGEMARVTIGEFQGEMASGRPRGKYLDGLSAWHRQNGNTHLIHDSVFRLGDKGRFTRAVAAQCTRKNFIFTSDRKKSRPYRGLNPSHMKCEPNVLTPPPPAPPESKTFLKC
ncbi:hypothetical protein BsWGS_23818 [Bradybaena similaris]